MKQYCRTIVQDMRPNNEETEPFALVISTVILNLLVNFREANVWRALKQTADEQNMTAQLLRAPGSVCVCPLT